MSILSLQNIFSITIILCLIFTHTHVYAKKNNTNHKKYYKHKSHIHKNKKKKEIKKPKCPAYIMTELKKYKNHKKLTHIARKESTFKPNAKNGHCIGLMQVNEKVWYKILKENGIVKSRKDLRSVKGNIRAGAYILKHYNNNYRRYQGKN